jgi:hypothetical protein
MKYAKMADDTMTYIYCYGMMAEGYDMKNMPDSALIVMKNAYQLYKNIGKDSYAAGLTFSLADIYLQKGEIQKAKEALYEYETETDFFDADDRIEQGREIFYYVKGQYYIHICQLDSAELFFRKELVYATGVNDRMAGYKGLLEIYEKRGNIDSLRKYTRLFMEIANSSHNEIEMQSLVQVQAMYDYSRNARIAFQKTQEANRFRNLFFAITAIAIIMMLIFSLFYIYYRGERRLTESKYHNDMEKLAQAQTDLLALRSEHHISETLLRQKDREVKALQHNIELYRRKIHTLQGYALNKRLQESEVTRRFKQYLKENPYKIPDYDDWKQLKMLINQEIPTFYDRLTGNGCLLRDFEYEVCILVRLQFSPSDISKLHQCVPSYITQVRKMLYKKIFKEEGLAEKFDEYIMSIS